MSASNKPWINIGRIEYQCDMPQIFTFGRNQIDAIVKKDIGFVTIMSDFIRNRDDGSFYVGSDNISIPLEIFDMVVEKINEARK